VTISGPQTPSAGRFFDSRDPDGRGHPLELRRAIERAIAEVMGVFQFSHWGLPTIHQTDRVATGCLQARSAVE
jgi:hypothetical protein